jgi:hypothetical protein
VDDLPFRCILDCASGKSNLGCQPDRFRRHFRSVAEPVSLISRKRANQLRGRANACANASSRSKPRPLQPTT